MMFLVFLLLFATLVFGQTSQNDTSQVYESEHNLLLEVPQKIWDAGVYPIGKFFIWEEKYAIHTRIYDFFTFHKHQIGIFPFLTIGGETGTAFGGTAFWRNFSGKDNSLNGLFTLANKKNYTGKAAFSNPELLGSKFLLETDFFYQKTENDFNYTSGFFHYKGYEEVSFAEKQLQTDFELAWRNQNHFFTTYLPETRISLVGGYKTFRADLPQNQKNLTSEQETELKKTVFADEKTDLASFGLKLSCDSRDYKEPSTEISLPLNYVKVPGLAAIDYNDKFFFQRNLGFPENGVFASAGAKFNKSFEDKLNFFSYEVELAKYFTLWTKFRVLAFRGKLQKIHEKAAKIPFGLQFPFADSQSLRGYERGAFRGTGTALLSAEYRWTIWDTWSAFTFLDYGQVFNSYNELKVKNFEYGFGAGISVWTERNFVCRVLFAVSKEEKFLPGFGVTQSF